MTEDAIKSVLRLLPYGFYCITSRSGEDSNIMVANWLVQVSFEPRLVALGLAKNAHSYGLVSAARVFAVCIFRAEDQEIVKAFTKGRAKNPDKMKDARYSPAPQTGCPVVEGAAAYFECRVRQIVDSGGDHDIVVAEVVGAELLKEGGEASDMLTLPHLGWSYAG